MTDFRRIPGADTASFSPGLLRERQHALDRRAVMLELAQDENETNFPYLNTVSLSDDVTRVAQQVRDILNISWDTQQKWYSPNDALNGWKEAIERLHVLVFQSNHQHNTVTFPSEEANGFSISEPHFPIIVLNSRDSHRRRIFTLLHEFTHLLLNNGGVCDTWEYANPQGGVQLTEVFCNHVAGSVLVPTSLLLAHSIIGSHGANKEWSDDEIKVIAEDFSTSQEVVLRRLLALALTTHSFYERKHQEYHRSYIEYKQRERSQSEGRAIPYFRLALRNNGKPFTRQVLLAYYDKKITLSDASDYLGTKIKHIKRMEQELFSIPTGV